MSERRFSKVVGSAIVLVATVAIGGCFWPRAPEGLAGAIDELVEAVMVEGPVSGVAVGVARGRRIIHTAGYGYADVENQLPVTPETVFRVGSISKQFTAAIIMQLAEEGALDLNDPLTKYLPDYPGYGSEVTISSLLNHTAGIKNYTTMERWWETLSVEMSPEQLVASFRDAPFNFRPGTNFSYTNSGYALLGVIAERLTGQPLGGIFNERLFVPLGLPSTSFCDDRALVPNRARGYQVVDGEFTHAPYISMSQAYAAGGVCSNVPDLLRWTKLLVRGSVVGNDAYDRMSTPVALKDGSRIEYGYGLAVSYLEQHHRVNHLGGMLGFKSQISHYDDDDVTIVVLTNTEQALASKLEGDIARFMLGLGDHEVKDLLLAPAELAQYTGTYDMTVRPVSIKALAGRLEAEVALPGLEGGHVLLYQGGDRFLAESDPEIALSFELQDGLARSLVLAHKGITMRGRRVEEAQPIG